MNGHIAKSSFMSVATDTFQDMENLQGFEGLSALEESAVRLHEVYKSLIAGGFTEDQALTLIAKMTRSGSDT
jgi:hypothetical protein